MCGIVGYVGTRRRSRGRRRRAAPDGVPRLRLLRGRPARRRRWADRPAPRPDGWPTWKPRSPRPTPRAWRAAPASGTPAGPPTAGRPTATRTRTGTVGQDRGRPQRHHRELRRRCARAGGRPASSSPATPTPRSRCTWSPGSTDQGVTAGDFAAVVLRGAAAGSRAHFTLVFANADDPGTIVAARRSTPLVRRRRRRRDVRRLRRRRVHRAHPRRRRARPGPGRGDHRRRLRDHRLRRHAGRRVPPVPYRLGPLGRREGRLRVLHAQGDRRAARRGRRHPARALRRRPHRARRAAPVRSGTARDRQGLHRRLRHRLSLRAAGQVRDRALDPAARRGRAGQRVPLPRPGAGPQHAGDRDLAVRRDRRHARGGAARQGAEGQGAGDLQHQRQPDPARMRRGALHPRRAGDRRRVDQDVPGADRRQLPRRSGARAGPRHQVPRRGGARVPRTGGDARAGEAGAGDGRTGVARWPTGSPSRRPCCSSAATSAIPSRSRAR